ncbi:hypothetical protein N752_08525 [Desulforamulus aquiferis]|nr:hypothetical protein N752_08525 [Desulforamulus aquiferis]
MSIALNSETNSQKGFPPIRPENGVLTTSRGLLHLEGPCTADYISRLTMDEGLRSFRPPARQQEALMLISNLPEERCLLPDFRIASSAM